MREQYSRAQADYLAEKFRMVKVLEEKKNMEAANRDIEQVCHYILWCLNCVHACRKNIANTVEDSIVTPMNVEYLVHV